MPIPPKASDGESGHQGPSTGSGQAVEFVVMEYLEGATRFLVNTCLEETVAEPITVVVNWRAGLNK